MELEEIRSANIDTVEKRLEEIRSMNIEQMNADELDNVDAETDALNLRKKSLKDEAEKKKSIRSKIVKNEVEVKEIAKPKEERKLDNELTEENYRSSKVYESAYTKRLMNKDLSVEERAAMVIGNNGGAAPAMPTTLTDRIIELAKQYCPILNEINLFRVPGGVSFVVEKTVNEAVSHEEGAAIAESSEELVNVDLAGYEVTKLISISDTVNNMTIEAFQTWLTTNLAQSVARKIEKIIFAGTGTKEGKGIDTISWGSTNSVTVGASASTTAQNVYDVFGLLKSDYATNARVYMTRKTLFSDYMNLQDKSKNDLITKDGANYYLLGTLVEFTSNLKDHEFILGDPNYYGGNLPEDINVKTSFDIDHNTNKYLGVAIFDGKPEIEEAFTKLVKATA